MKGPLDDIWVYDPSMGDLGAWFKIQGTGHSGMDPSNVPPMAADDKLLWYQYALFGIGVGGAGSPETSWTLAATVPELGAGCSLGTACPLVSSQTQAHFTNGDDANEYAIDFSRIGALVGASATSTSDGKTMMLYGGLSRTRTYIPVFDNPHNSWFAGFSASQMPFQTNTPHGRFYFIYNNNDMANLKAAKTQVITQLAFALTTPLSGLYEIKIGSIILNAASTAVPVIDAVTMTAVADVSSTSGHVVNNYLTLSGLNIDITSLTDGKLLIIVMQATRSTSSPTTSSLHNTLIACAPTAGSETTLLTQPYSPSVLTSATVLPRIAFSYFDTVSASYQGHTLANCAAAMRFSHYGRPAMGPSNLLWSIDMSKATSALAQTTATLVSGSLLPNSKPAIHKFYSRTDLVPSDPSGPTDPIAAIGYAYTYGLHAAVAEICQDWFRYSSRVYSNDLTLREGAADLLLHQAGYEITQTPPALSDTNVVNYPPAVAFGAVFPSSKDAVYLVGGASMLHKIDARDNPSSDNSFPISAINTPISSSLPTNLYGFSTAPGAMYANRQLYAFGDPVETRPFTFVRPDLQSIVFASDFATIDLTFDAATNTPAATTTPSAATCALVLTASSLDSITSQSLCAWKSRRLFTIFLHENHRVVPSTTVLGIKAYTVYSARNPSAFSAPAKALPVGITTPSQVVAVVSPVGTSTPCQPLVLSAIASTGAYGKRMLYLWEVLPIVDSLTGNVLNQVQIDTLKTILKNLPDRERCLADYSLKPEEAVCVPELRLNAGEAAAVLLANNTSTIRVTITNRFGDVGTASTDVARSDTSKPSITLDRFDYRKEFNAPLLLATTVAATRCLPSTVTRRTLEISWTLVSGAHSVNFTDPNEVILNGYNMILVPYGLGLGKYTFKATITESHYNETHTLDTLSSTTSEITVRIFTTPPTAKLTGSIDRTVSLQYLESNLLPSELAVPNVIYSSVVSVCSDEHGSHGQPCHVRDASCFSAIRVDVLLL